MKRIYEGWLARDESGELCLGQCKPNSESGVWINMGEYMQLSDSDFPDVTFKNSPVKVRMTIEVSKEEKDTLPSFDEQQGAPIIDIEIPFGARDSELQEATYIIPKGFHAEIQGDEVVIKKGEKKSSWSEEDENNLIDTCVAIRKFYHGTNGAQELIDWLKSLKQRCTWKPTGEQIVALRWVLNNIPYNKHKEEISGLLDQIKDL